MDDSFLSVQRTTSALGNLFVLVTALVGFGRGKYNITVAGYDWIIIANESTDSSIRTNSSIGLFFMSYSLVLSVVSVIVLLFRSVLASSVIRKRATSNKSGSQLAAPNIFYTWDIPWDFNSRLNILTLWVLFLGYSVVLVVAAVSNLQGPVKNLILLLVVFLLTRTIYVLLLHLSHNNFNFWLGEKRRTYNRLSCSLFGILIDKLLQESNSFDGENEKILIGLVHSSPKYDVIGGTYEGDVVGGSNDGDVVGGSNDGDVVGGSNDGDVEGGSYDLDNRREPFENLLTPGLNLNEIIVYANEKSTIRVLDAESDSELEEVFKLTSKIRCSTSETNKRKILTMGTAAWALFVSSVLDVILGPGPWPGVDGIDKSLIWLGVIVLLGRYIDFAYPIAFCVYPLCGNAEPGRDICKWKDRAGGRWVVFSDDEGIIRMRLEREGRESSDSFDMNAVGTKPVEGTQAQESMDQNSGSGPSADGEQGGIDVSFVKTSTLSG